MRVNTELPKKYPWYRNSYDIVSGSFYNNMSSIYQNKIIDFWSFTQVMDCCLGGSDGMIAGFVEPRRRFSGTICDIGSRLVERDIPLALPMAAKYQEWAECEE